MALFGAKDANLPLLTQFFQIDDPGEAPFEETELFQWLSTRGGNLLLLNPAGSKTFKRIADIQRVVKRIMRSMHDDKGPIRADDLNTLFNLYREAPATNLEYWMIYSGGAANKDGWVDPTSLRFGSWNKETFDWGLGTRIIEALVGNDTTVGHIFHPERFAECPECRNIYLKLNPRALYCSQRCGHRRLMRTRRDREKAVKLSGLDNTSRHRYNRSQ